MSCAQVDIAFAPGEVRLEVTCFDTHVDRCSAAERDMAKLKTTMALGHEVRHEQLWDPVGKSL